MARQNRKKPAQYLRPNIGSIFASHPKATKEDILNEEKTGANPQPNEGGKPPSYEPAAKPAAQAPSAPCQRLSDIVGEAAIRAVEEALRKQHPS